MDGSPINKNAIIQFHRARLSHQGTAPLGWRDEHTQRVRFEALCEWGDIEGLHVLDLGCGKADLWDFFAERGGKVRYTGMDIVPEFVHEAHSRLRGEKQVRIVQASFWDTPIPLCDVAFLSGSLNYQSHMQDEPWNCLRRIWASARLGMAFNMLDARKQPSTSFIRSFDPDEVLRFCHTLDPQARLLHGYHPEDFSLLLKH